MAAAAAVLAVSATALAMTGGHASAQGSCLGSGVTIFGTIGDDVLVGTEGDDVISAIGGDDVVDGGAGNDKICLGEGSDGAQGGAGDDQIESATGDDTVAGDFLESTEPGRGNDDVAGGDGNDIVVGDSSNSAGTAVGIGNDKTNGGGGNDIVVGDAFSNSLAAGAGEDDLDVGPGDDIAIGDALTGTPSAPAEAPSGAAADAGVTGPEALGSGGDVINSQTETDFIVGDAAIFNFPSAARRGNLAVLAACSEKAARKIQAGFFWGLTDEEILEWIRRSKHGDRIRAEFQDDWQIGDCLGAGGDAQGAAPDDLNSGTENDVSVGDNVATGNVSGNQPGDEAHLGGKGNDMMWGDNVDASIAFTIGSAAIQINSAAADNPKAAWFRQDRLPSLFGGPGSARVYTSWFDINSDTENRPRRAAADVRRGGSVSGGGDDHVRGGQGEDFLEGGPKDDKCSGGPQKDTFVDKGPNKCEDITGAP